MFGLEVVDIAELVPHSYQAPIYWIHRFSWLKVGEPFFDPLRPDRQQLL